MGWAGSISKDTIRFLREELNYANKNLETFQRDMTPEMRMVNPTYMYFFGKVGALKELDKRLKFTDENLWPIDK